MCLTVFENVLLYHFNRFIQLVLRNASYLMFIKLMRHLFVHNHDCLYIIFCPFCRKKLQSIGKNKKKLVTVHLNAIRKIFLKFCRVCTTFLCRISGVSFIDLKLCPNSDLFSEESYYINRALKIEWINVYFLRELY